MGGQGGRKFGGLYQLRAGSPSYGVRDAKLPAKLPLCPPKRGGEWFRVPRGLKKEGDSSYLTMRQLQGKINRAAEASAPLVLPWGVLTVPSHNPGDAQLLKQTGLSWKLDFWPVCPKSAAPRLTVVGPSLGALSSAGLKPFQSCGWGQRGQGHMWGHPFPRALLTPFKACSEFDSRYLGTALTEGDPAIRLLGAALGPKIGLLYCLALLPGEREQVYKTL